MPTSDPQPPEERDTVWLLPCGLALAVTDAWPASAAIGRVASRQDVVA